MKSLYFKTYILLYLLFVSSHLQATHLELTPAELAFEQDLLSSHGGVKTFQKLTRLYHYFNPATDDSGSIWPTYRTLQYRHGSTGQTVFDLSYKAGDFWNPSVQKTKMVNAGPGLYLAIDPVVSENYGNTYYIIDFPSDSKIIDVTDPTWKNVSKIKLNKNTIQLLISEGILTTSHLDKLGMKNGYFTRNSMQYMAAEGLEKYRNMITKIFTKNNIQLIQYTWESSYLKTICAKKNSSAFVFVGSEPSEIGQSTKAIVSPQIYSNTVLDSTYSIPEQTDHEKAVIDLTRKFKNLIKNKTPLTPEEVQTLKSISFECT